MKTIAIKEGLLWGVYVGLLGILFTIITVL